jgi:acetyl/propionyl-CoA carboxylase alpha subunit
VDRTALHVRHADEAYPIGGSAPADSYLRIDRIVEAARRARADAVHPGYGFLAEHDGFARAVRDAGLIFIGPSPEAMALMGSKTAARKAAAQAGVPVVAGTSGAVDADLPDAELQRVASSIGYPLLVKAVAGGGGKGMRAVADPAELSHAVRSARSEAAASFGDPAVYFERQLRTPRHVEIQLLGDLHGTVLPFTERECSIQRRHQKIVEESPSPAVTPELRRTLADAAARVARAAGYTGAGTIEFLLEPDGTFAFLEMNTRLQVEHPVTEMVAGLDLVQWQIRIARGERLTVNPDELLVPKGHAIECRVSAEDPDDDFLPSPGTITSIRSAAGPGIREDSCAFVGYDVPLFYDPLIAKLIAWSDTRAGAIARMRRALRECMVAGIRTTLPFFVWLLDQPAFASGAFHTTTLDEMLRSRQGRPFLEVPREIEEMALVAAALHGAPARAADTSPARQHLSPSRWKDRARLEALQALAVRR